MYPVFESRPEVLGGALLAGLCAVPTLAGCTSWAAPADLTPTLTPHRSQALTLAIIPDQVPPQLYDSRTSGTGHFLAEAGLPVRLTLINLVTREFARKLGLED